VGMVGEMRAGGGTAATLAAPRPHAGPTPETQVVARQDFIGGRGQGSSMVSGSPIVAMLYPRIRRRDALGCT